MHQKLKIKSKSNNICMMKMNGTASFQKNVCIVLGFEPGPNISGIWTQALKQLGFTAYKSLDLYTSSVYPERFLNLCV